MKLLLNGASYDNFFEQGLKNINLHFFYAILSENKFRNEFRPYTDFDQPVVLGMINAMRTSYGWCVEMWPAPFNEGAHNLKKKKMLTECVFLDNAHRIRVNIRQLTVSLISRELVCPWSCVSSRDDMALLSEQLRQLALQVVCFAGGIFQVTRTLLKVGG